MSQPATDLVDIELVDQHAALGRSYSGRSVPRKFVSCWGKVPGANERMHASASDSMYKSARIRSDLDRNPG